jgi:hypothetical protein
VPTLITYDPNDVSIMKWGAQVDWRCDAAVGVKLLLDPDQPRPLYFEADQLKDDAKSLPKRAVDIVADYLAALFKHGLAVIESNSIKEYFESCRRDFIITVPAVWSDKAKDLTLQVSTISRNLFNGSNVLCTGS